MSVITGAVVINVCLIALTGLSVYITGSLWSILILLCGVPINKIKEEKGGECE
jgi:hypothetical protein